MVGSYRRETRKNLFNVVLKYPPLHYILFGALKFREKKVKFELTLRVLRNLLEPPTTLLLHFKDRPGCLQLRLDAYFKSRTQEIGIMTCKTEGRV